MEGTIITFNFCALTFQDLTVSYYLALLVQLIGPEGLEDKTREANCLLQSDITLKGAPSAQANFVCTIENVEGKYSSLRLHSSDGELKDYSKVTSIPPTFSFE